MSDDAPPPGPLKTKRQLAELFQVTTKTAGVEQGPL
jgi:hypothetical protein